MFRNGRWPASLATASLVTVLIVSPVLGQGPLWSDFRVSWGLFPRLLNYMRPLPRLESQVQAAGWTLLNTCTGAFLGKRYILNGDYSTVLLYDINGYIAGVQFGVERDEANNFPYPGQINKPFVQDGNFYYLTTYFVDPGRICEGGRNETEFTQEGTGTGLWFQNGLDPRVDLVHPPNLQADLDPSQWTGNICLRSMGVHFSNFRSDLNCEEFFPYVAIYNRGRLTAFNFVAQGNYRYPRFETFPRALLPITPLLVPTFPRCFANKNVKALHVFFTSDPWNNPC